VAGGDGERCSKPTLGIWKTLEEAKRKQDSIRKRVRKYGRDDDRDYSDSPSCDKGSDSDSSEYDEEIDLQMLQEDIEVLYQHQYQQQDKKRQQQQQQQQHIKGQPEQDSSLPQTTKNDTPKKKKSGLKNSILKCNSVGIGIEDKKKVQARLRSSMKSRFRRGHSNTPRDDDAAPALTPREAIVLVMKRHAYISDSDSEEFITRKGSYSTIDTAALSNTLTDDEHRENSLSPTGKRVVIRRRKRKEDTHTITSKQQYRAINININSPPSLSRTNQEHGQQQQQLEPPKPQPLVSIENAQKQQHVDNNNNYVTLTQARLSPSLQSLRRGEQRAREEEASQQQQQQDDEYGVSNRDDDSEQGESSINSTGESKDHSAIIANKRSQQKALANDGTNNNDDEYDCDYDSLGTDDSISKVQTPSSFGTPGESQKNNATSEGLDSSLQELENDDGDGADFVMVSITSDDGEDNSTPSSFTTAKTSKSAISKYSKASRKALEQDDWENDQKDDISFFDAMQDGEESNSDKSFKLSGAPLTVITDNQNKGEQGEEDDEGPGEDDGEGGWAARITSFVGYTIGTLANWEESGEAGDAQNTSTKKTAGEAESPSKHSGRVPSHELEIVKICQEEQRRRQAEENERRKLEAAYSNTHKNIELLRQEEEARVPIWKEVMEYRSTMQGMGMSEMLAPLDSKVAAQEYDDRLSMGKTLEEQERKCRLNERNMREMDMLDQEADQPGGCACDCIVS